MTIDELESELTQQEQGQQLDRFAGERIYSDTRYLNYLYAVADHNKLRVVCWPKMIVIPEEHYDFSDPEMKVEYLANDERLYKHGLAHKEKFSLTKFLYDHYVRPLKIRKYNLMKKLRFLTGNYSYQDLDSLYCRIMESREKLKYEHKLKNLNTDIPELKVETDATPKKRSKNDIRKTN